MPVFRHRVYVKRGFPRACGGNHSGIDVTHPLRIVNEGIRAEIHRVDLSVLFRPCYHGRLAQQRDPGQGVNVIDMPRNG